MIEINNRSSIFNIRIKNILIIILILLASPVITHTYISGSDKITHSDVFVLLFFCLNIFFFIKPFINHILLIICLFILLQGLIIYDYKYDSFSLLKSIIQNIIVISILFNNYNFYKINYNRVLIFFFFLFINLIAFFNVSLFDENAYAAINTAPFFDSIDKGFFFVMMLVFVNINKNIFNKWGLFLLTSLSSLNILFSGSRTALMILLLLAFYFLIKRLKKNKFVFVGILTLIFIGFNIYPLEDILIDRAIVGQKQATLFIELFKIDFSELIYFVLNDSSFLVRIDNIKIIFNEMGFFNYFFGFGSESWRNLLIGRLNSSLDNSLIVFFFNYGIFGLIFFFILFKKIFNNLGKQLGIVILIFVMFQDILGNFMFISNILFFQLLMKEKDEI